MRRTFLLQCFELSRIILIIDTNLFNIDSYTWDILQTLIIMVMKSSIVFRSVKVIISLIIIFNKSILIYENFDRQLSNFLKWHIY